MSQAREILERTGAMMSPGHYVYTSGKHGAHYVNVRVLRQKQNEQDLRAIARLMAEQAVWAAPDVVVVPESSDEWLGPVVVEELSDMMARPIPMVSAHKVRHGDRVMSFELTIYDIRKIPGSRIMIIDDTVNQGGSVQMVIDEVRVVGGLIAMFVCVCNRTGKTFDLGDGREAALVNLAGESLQVYPPGKGSCPLCDADVPINTNVGHGAAYLDSLKRR